MACQGAHQGSQSESQPRMRTALVYDPFNLKHTLAGHPENYRRLQGTWALLQEDGILDDLLSIESSPAPPNALLQVHDRAYVDQVKRLSTRGGGHLDPDTYVNQDSYRAALLAAGGLLNVVDAVLAGEADNGFALVRPPGHHARPRRGMGFCLFGNVAIAARHARARHGVERILIVDFDVHHGNGTQEMFYADGEVLFFSTHQYPFYPGTGSVSETGQGRGRGTTINVPFGTGVGDAGHLAAFRQILTPLAREFQPQFILVSAGYDAHWMDPLAGLSLSITAYAHLLEHLMELAGELCQGRLACVLEGGYHLDVLPHCVLTSLRVLSDNPLGPSDPFGPSPRAEPDISGLLDEVKAWHGLA
jgi:acetoin utilization deacetylase AcuC-like enzyme